MPKNIVFLLHMQFYSTETDVCMDSVGRGYKRGWGYSLPPATSGNRGESQRFCRGAHASVDS